MSELIRITKIEPAFTELYCDDLIIENCDLLSFVAVEFKTTFENMEIQGTYKYDLADYEGLSANDYRKHVEMLLGKLADKIADTKER